MREATKQFGADDPLTKQLVEFYLHVVRGDVGYRGRYIGQRLTAATRLFDQRLGKPSQPVEHSGTVTLEQLVTAANAPGKPSDKS